MEEAEDERLRGGEPLLLLIDRSLSLASHPPFGSFVSFASLW